MLHTSNWISESISLLAHSLIALLWLCMRFYIRRVSMSECARIYFCSCTRVWLRLFIYTLWSTPCSYREHTIYMHINWLFYWCRYRCMMAPAPFETNVRKIQCQKLNLIKYYSHATFVFFFEMQSSISTVDININGMIIHWCFLSDIEWKAK